MMTAPPPILTPAKIIRFTDYWVSAAVFQGARLLGIVESQTSDMRPMGEWTDEDRQAFDATNRLGHDHLVEELDGYFLIVAARNALRWLRRVRDVPAAAELVGPIDAFLPAVEHVIDLRNMYEHEEEYLDGEGNNQDRYLHTGELFEASAHSIVVRGDDYLVGGRVNVITLVAALRELQQHVQRVYIANHPGGLVLGLNVTPASAQ